MSDEDRDELVEYIASAVIARMEQRDRVNRLADMVVERVLAAQDQQAEEDFLRSAADSAPSGEETADHG